MAPFSTDQYFPIWPSQPDRLRPLKSSTRFSPFGRATLWAQSVWLWAGGAASATRSVTRNKRGLNALMHRKALPLELWAVEGPGRWNVSMHRKALAFARPDKNRPVRWHGRWGVMELIVLSFCSYVLGICASTPALTRNVTHCSVLLLLPRL